MRRLRSSLALLVVCALSAACGGGSDRRASSTTTSTTEAGDAGDGADGAPDGDSPTTPSSLVPGGAPEPPEGGDASTPARREDIPKAGRYTYETMINRQKGEELLDVIEAGEGEGYVRQLHIQGTNEDATSQAVVWLGNLFYAEAEQIARAGTPGMVCVWNPGLVLLSLPLAVGASWTADATCEDDPEAAVRHRTIEAEVTGTDRVDVGGSPVDVFVVELSVTYTVEDDNPPLKVVETIRATDHVAADRNLVVRSEGVRDVTLAGLPQEHETFLKTLVSLVPQQG